MEQSAIVLRPLWRSLEQETPAQELRFDFTGQSAGRLAGHLQLLVGVVVQVGVLGHLVVGDTETGVLEKTVALARLVAFQAEVFEIVDTLGVHELDELAGGAAIGVAQLTLQGDVVVFGGAACETMLKILKSLVNVFKKLSCKKKIKM